MLDSPHKAISPVDGRYVALTKELVPYVSEYALMGYRLRVETEYLMALSELRGFGPRRFSKKEIALLRKLPILTEGDAEHIKEIETTTNHDVKAIEYYLREKLADSSLKDVTEWIHFGITSEDTNNISYALILRDVLEAVIIPSLEKLQTELSKLASKHAPTAMLARTHGQAATPTTFGKEMEVFRSRLRRELGKLNSFVILSKLNGATGNYNALAAALPSIDWVAFSRKFIARASAFGKKISIECNTATTQIEPHDSYAELFQLLARINTILIGFDQDMWRYISDGWVVQKAVSGETGSSTMPHKVNPIDFENSEGNLGLANALLNFFAAKLPISRLQRDISDSTVLRNFGVALAHSLIGYKSAIKGLGKIAPDRDAMKRALLAHPEVIAEAIQIILRREGVRDAYETLKTVTRGRNVSLKDLRTFIGNLSVSPSVKKELLKLAPEAYIGLAKRLAKGQ